MKTHSSLLLLSLLGLAAQAQTLGSVDVEGGAFLTPWQRSDNRWVGARARLLHKGDQLSGAFSLLARSDSTMPVLGNIESLLFRARGSSWSFGRREAFVEDSFFGLAKQLNHRVCQNPWDCSKGGPIGAHYSSSTWRLSFEALYMPNISPTPSVDERGRLSSAYRWTEVPYQFVSVGGARLPVRVSADIDYGVSTLLSPGAFAEKELVRSGGFTLLTGAAAYRSRSPLVEREDGLVFVDEGDGPIAVANSHQQASFPWVGHVWARADQRFGSRHAVQLEASHLRRASAASSEGALGTTHAFGPLRLRQRMGYLRIDKADAAVFEGELGLHFTGWSMGGSALGVLGENGSSLVLTPYLSRQLSDDLSLKLRGFLAQTRDTEALLGSSRAHDHVTLGVAYAF